MEFKIDEETTVSVEENVPTSSAIVFEVGYKRYVYH